MSRVISKQSLLSLNSAIARSLYSRASIARPAPYLPLNATTPAPSLPLPALTRSFTSSPVAYKKKDKGGSSGGSGSSSKAAPAGGAEEDLGFDALQKSIDDAVARLKDDVSKLRTGSGGRFNPQLIESLRVSVDKKSKETARLGDIAQVIPKGGRALTILLGDEEHSKAVSSAISSSNLSLNAQPYIPNPLQLNVPIPPPTKESRDQAVKDAKAAMEKASMAVKNARQNLNKKLKEAGQKKKIQPDMLRGALEKMEKIAQQGQKGVKDAFEAAQRALSQ
ncbi:hypothetical protein KEM55_003156 [Ascosphaera atra]|nr:hypothetical protein KEM55_003156 [Ascosphaera atra]